MLLDHACSLSLEIPAWIMDVVVYKLDSDLTERNPVLGQLTAIYVIVLYINVRKFETMSATLSRARNYPLGLGLGFFFLSLSLSLSL